MEHYLIVGLGNPGRRYEKTRHNVGWWVIDELAQRYQIAVNKKERKSFTGDGMILNKRVILAKPQTYMNLSGEAVRALLDFYNIPVDNFIVVHDDLDTPLGVLKLRKQGGHGGQNGIRNIIMHLGTKDFARVRFGIGRPPGKMQAKDYVLQKFFGDDIILAQQVIEKASDSVEGWLKEGIEKAMSTHNGDVNQPPPEAKPKPEDELALAIRAYELTPDDPKPLEKMTRLYKRLRQLDKAVETHILLADLHERQGRIKSMLAELEKVIAIRPDNTELREMMAREYERIENNKRAVHTWIQLAEYYLKQDDEVGALTSIEEAIRINPQHPKAQSIHADILKETE